MRHVVMTMVCLFVFSTTSYAEEAFYGADSPEQAVRVLAAAVRDKDVNTFNNIVDINSLIDSPSALDNPGFDKIPSAAIRLRRTNAIIEGIASGTYALACARAERPGCPWYPEGLEKAQISRPDNRSAVVAVDSAKNIRTWLVMHDTDAGWRFTAASDRLQDAETFASVGFLETLETYQEEVKEKQRRETRKQIAKDVQTVSATERAATLLNGIPLSDFEYEVEDGDPHQELTVKCTATNTHAEPVRLMRMKVRLVDDSDGEPYEYEVLHGAEVLQPGESKVIELKSPIRENSRLREMAAKLERGSCTASARATGLVLGPYHVHIDEDGTDLWERP